MCRRLPPRPLLAVAALLAVPSPGRAQVHFTDATAAAGLDFVHFNGMTGQLYFSEMMGSGAGLVDYDGDGDLDLYLVQGAMLDSGEDPRTATPPPRGEPIDRLYRNDLAPGPDGRAVVRLVDVTASAGLAETGYGMGVAVGDVDNDGWSDLYVTNLGPDRLYRNRRDGTFADATVEAGLGDRGWGVSASFLDFDRDGWLDLYVGNYVDFGLATHKTCFSPTGAVDYCGPLAFQPEPDALYRNRGDGTFETVSGRSGIAADPKGALGVVALDADADGWLDLLVANDQVPNKLWINQGDGTFVDDALLSGTGVNEQGQPEANMGVVAGDLDGDGDEDLFITHLTQETNTLYLNDGSGLFDDATRESGLGLPSWPFTGFGVAMSDFDRDGRLDLAVVNGAVRRIEEQTARGDPYPLAQTHQVFHNLGGGRWAEVTSSAGEPFAHASVGRGLAKGDLDLDGDEDLLLANSSGPAVLLANDSPPRGRFLGVAALLAAGGREAFGTALRLTDGAGGRQLRRVGTDGSYASANAPLALFGVPGPAPLALAADWLGGGTTRWEGVPADRRLVVVRRADVGSDR